jgi:hypothetical protein
MLPMGMSSVALIAAYECGGSLRSMASSCWQRGGSSAKAARSAAFRSAMRISSSITVSSANCSSASSCLVPPRSDLRAAVTTRRHSRCVVVASHPGSAAGSRSLPSCSTSSSHTFCATSSRSELPSWNRVQMDHTSGAYRSTISFHAPGSLPAARVTSATTVGSSRTASPRWLALSHHQHLSRWQLISFLTRRAPRRHLIQRTEAKFRRKIRIPRPVG